MFALPREILPALRFPVGELQKDAVRRLAAEHQLRAVTHQESQDFCVAQRGDLAETLRERFGGVAKKGLIRGADGEPLGEHDGLHHFTIGQRKGLKVAVGERAYVVGIDVESGDVQLGPADALLSEGLVASDCNWLSDSEDELDVEVKIRYRHDAAPARLRRSGRRALVHFQTRQRAITPGQAAVFYRGDRVLGGGWIEHAGVPA